VYTLNDLWIRPAFGGKGRKMPGQLEAHFNGFRYSTPKGEALDIMYRCRTSFQTLTGSSHCILEHAFVIKHKIGRLTMYQEDA
jgi:nucleosome binding factor SPN SPT16 subunit